MNTLARLTAIMLIFIGLLTLVGGGYLVSRGWMQTEPFMPGLFGAIQDTSMLFPVRLLIGGGLVVQGFVLAAAGEALWLIAGIAARSEHSSQHLAMLAARGSMTIP